MVWPITKNARLSSASSYERSIRQSMRCRSQGQIVQRAANQNWVMTFAGMNRILQFLAPLSSYFLIMVPPRYLQVRMTSIPLPWSIIEHRILLQPHVLISVSGSFRRRRDHRACVGERPRRQSCSAHLADLQPTLLGADSVQVEPVEARPHSEWPFRARLSQSTAPA